jgi:hypothetical protein
MERLDTKGKLEMVSLQYLYVIFYFVIHLCIHFSHYAVRLVDSKIE